MPSTLVHTFAPFQNTRLCYNNNIKHWGKTLGINKCMKVPERERERGRPVGWGGGDMHVHVFTRKCVSV